MAYKNLSEFVEALEKRRELVRIREFVSPRLEIAEVTDRISKNRGKALLFENTATGFPVFINGFGSPERICMALGIRDMDQIGLELHALLARFMEPGDSFLSRLKLLPELQKMASLMPHAGSGRGACQEVVMTPPDLGRLPVLTCWPGDGGPFVTLPVVHTRDLHTGIRNLGMYRMQVFGPDRTGMHWHLHKNSARHFRQYKEARKVMPVTVTLGGDPAYTYAATAPLPDQFDEYLLAGFLRKKRVHLVKCLTNDLEIPADVDFVIEGYVDPLEEPVVEGPFGDHTGFYSLPDLFPVFHVTCITHRRNAIYPATIVGIPPQEDAWIGKATERIFLEPIRMALVPEILDMEMPAEGVFHNITIVKILNSYPGQAFKVMNALWGAGQMMFNKIMVVVDGPVNIHDPYELALHMARHADPATDIMFSKGPLDILDHSSQEYAYGGKIGIDATIKPEHGDSLPPMSAVPAETLEMLAGRVPGIAGLRPASPEGLPVLFVFVKHVRSGSVKDIHDNLLNAGLPGSLRLVIYFDENAAGLEEKDLLWLMGNHLDPLRDCFLFKVAGGAATTGMAADATRKTRSGGFSRDWPNVIVSDEATIKAVDEKWPLLGLGALLPSPSLKYRSLSLGPGAIAQE